ncbi:MAG: signal peptidase I [Treponema sp.]|nr:signal peptidase I [Treponema sp.]
MFEKKTYYSYAAQKHQRHRALKFFLVFLFFYITYNCLCAFLISVWVVDNNTMQPGLNRGDRIIFYSFTPPWNFNKEDSQYIFKRGSIVLVDKRHYKDSKLPLRLADGLVRFFTAQKVSIFSGEGQYYIKRVIGLPGDEISMSNYGFRVKEAQGSFALTEYELSQRPYHTSIPQTGDISGELWDDSIPFSGSMDTIILGPDECYVVSDDRSNTNDSRTWGAISPSIIKARAVLRFWPPNKIGFL